MQIAKLNGTQVVYWWFQRLNKMLMYMHIIKYAYAGF